jgi:hypothetical protein
MKIHILFNKIRDIIYGKDKKGLNMNYVSNLENNKIFALIIHEPFYMSDQREKLLNIKFKDLNVNFCIMLNKEIS